MRFHGGSATDQVWGDCCRSTCIWIHPVHLDILHIRIQIQEAWQVIVIDRKAALGRSLIRPIVWIKGPQTCSKCIHDDDWSYDRSLQQAHSARLIGQTIKQTVYTPLKLRIQQNSTNDCTYNNSSNNNNNNNKGWIIINCIIVISTIKPSMTTKLLLSGLLLDVWNERRLASKILWQQSPMTLMAAYFQFLWKTIGPD